MKALNFNDPVGLHRGHVTVACSHGSLTLADSVKSRIAIAPTGKSDFYLRLTGSKAKRLRGELPAESTHVE